MSSLPLRVFGVLLLALGARFCDAAVWPVKAQWDELAEQRYSEWVEENFHSHFFYEGTPYQDIGTDCADAAYGMRMTFAYEQGLPFTFRHASGLVSQASTRFDNVRAGLPRFRAFLNWVMDNTSTATLVHDTYPVRIDRQHIRPGIIYLTSRVHAMQVVELRPYGVIRYLESTAPRAIRPMRSIVGFPHQVPGEPGAAAHSDGFRRFKTPADYGKPDRSLPGYGDEQFIKARELGRESLPFYEWVQQRLAEIPEPLDILAHRSMFSICAMAYDRASAVDEAQALLRDLRRQRRSRMTAVEIDEHSTPTRDRLLLRAMEHLSHLPQRAGWSTLTTKYRGFVDLMTGNLNAGQEPQVRAQLLDWCDLATVDGGPERSMDLRELYDLLKAGRLDSDPQVTVRRRWGEGKR